MKKKSSWSLQERKEAWRLIWDSSNLLNLPLSPTISTSFFYLHHYFEVSGNLDISLFTASILSTFVASKTEETRISINSLISNFIKTALTRNSESLSTLGVDKEELTKIKNDSTEFEDYREKILDDELDFMTAMQWQFPDFNPFYALSEYLRIIQEKIEKEYFNKIPQQEYERISNNNFEIINQESIKNMCIHHMFPNLIHENMNDLAASAIEYTWRNTSIPQEIPHWSTFVKYDIDIDKIEHLIQRISDWKESQGSF